MYRKLELNKGIMKDIQLDMRAVLVSTDVSYKILFNGYINDPYYVKGKNTKSITQEIFH